jgi:hypothetical protein
MREVREADLPDVFLAVIVPTRLLSQHARHETDKGEIA